jgi:hypothetical protein
MKKHALIATLLLAAALQLDAAELLPRVESNAVSVQIRGLEFPDTLREDLVSGLTNRILIRATLAMDGRLVAQSTVDIAIRYDLWEETFRVTMSTDGRTTPPRTFASLETTTAFLRDFSASGLFAGIGLERGRTFTVTADVLFDPIDRDRMEKIRQWVARNSTFPGSGAQRPSTGSSPSADLFNRIFEQYASGAEFASVWRQRVASGPFRPEDVSRQP